MDNGMVLYMEVTKDEYELPIAVATTASELSRMRNVPLGTIFTYISKKLGRFYKIVIPSEEYDDVE